jgi:hypothetical protein
MYLKIDINVSLFVQKCEMPKTLKANSVEHHLGESIPASKHETKPWGLTLFASDFYPLCLPGNWMIAFIGKLSIVSLYRIQLLWLCQIQITICFIAKRDRMQSLSYLCCKNAKSRHLNLCRLFHCSSNELTSLKVLLDCCLIRIKLITYYYSRLLLTSIKPPLINDTL